MWIARNVPRLARRTYTSRPYRNPGLLIRYSSTLGEGSATTHSLDRIASDARRSGRAAVEQRDAVADVGKSVAETDGEAAVESATDLADLGGVGVSVTETHPDAPELTAAGRSRPSLEQAKELSSDELASKLAGYRNLCPDSGILVQAPAARETSVEEPPVHKEEPPVRKEEGSVKETPAQKDSVTSLFSLGIQPTQTINIYFSQPIRTVWMIFEDEDIATKVQSRFAAGEYTISGRTVTATLSRHVSRGQPAWELALESIPVEVSEADITASIRESHQPGSIVLGKPLHEVDYDAALKSIRSEVGKLGALLRSQARPAADMWSKHVLAATFIEAVDMQRAVDSLQDAVITVGRRSFLRLQIRRLQRAKFRIPITLHEHLRPSVEELKERYASHGVQVVDGTVKWGYKTVMVQGDELATLEQAKLDMDALLDGEVALDPNGTVLWSKALGNHASTFSQTPAIIKLKMVERALGITVIRDISKSRLIVYGPEGKRQEAIRLIRKVVEKDHDSANRQTTNYWHKRDIDEFAASLGLIARFATPPPGDKPVFKRFLSASKSVAASSANREVYYSDLAKLQQALGHTPGPARDSAGQEAGEVGAPAFRKTVPGVSAAAKTFLSARLNPRTALPDADGEGMGVVKGIAAHPATAGSPAWKEVVTAPLVRKRLVPSKTERSARKAGPGQEADRREDRTAPRGEAVGYVTRRLDLRGRKEGEEGGL